MKLATRRRTYLQWKVQWEGTRGFQEARMDKTEERPNLETLQMHPAVWVTDCIVLQGDRNDKWGSRAWTNSSRPSHHLWKCLAILDSRDASRNIAAISGEYVQRDVLLRESENPQSTRLVLNYVPTQATGPNHFSRGGKQNLLGTSRMWRFFPLTNRET